MKSVRVIRHGESAANAGAATLDHASIPLTEKGLYQAELVAQSISQCPELIITSPFSRAQATASATARLLPTVPLEVWPIEEFSYLDPAKCLNTTLEQRKSWVDQYWIRSEPSYRDGAGAESFLDLVGRARSFLDRLAAHPAQDILVFSHGQFLNAVAWLIERLPLQIDGPAMLDWRRFEIANHIPNGNGYLLSCSPSDHISWTRSHTVDLNGVQRPYLSSRMK